MAEDYIREQVNTQVADERQQLATLRARLNLARKKYRQVARMAKNRADRYLAKLVAVREKLRQTVVRDGHMIRSEGVATEIEALVARLDDISIDGPDDEGWPE